MFDFLSQMLLEVGAAATPTKVALAICGVALVALGVVIVLMVI